MSTSTSTSYSTASTSALQRLPEELQIKILSPLIPEFYITDFYEAAMQAFYIREPYYFVLRIGELMRVCRGFARATTYLLSRMLKNGLIELKSDVKDFWYGINWNDMPTDYGSDPRAKVLNPNRHVNSQFKAIFMLEIGRVLTAVSPARVTGRMLSYRRIQWHSEGFYAKRRTPESRILITEELRHIARGYGILIDEDE